MVWYLEKSDISVLRNFATFLKHIAFLCCAGFVDSFFLSLSKKLKERQARKAQRSALLLQYFNYPKLRERF